MDTLRAQGTGLVRCATKFILLCAALLGGLLVALTSSAQTPASASTAPWATLKTRITFEDVRREWNEIRPLAPPELAGASLDDLASAFSRWIRDRDETIRDRVARGDLDSLVNLWLFGTSYTPVPPARQRDVDARGDGATVSEFADRRMADLLAALARPEANSRLRWAAQFFVTQGARPGTPRGDARIRALLEEAYQRMRAENADYARTLAARNTETDLFARMRAYASLYRDRGLSGDTSILSSYAVDSALDVLVNSQAIGSGLIRRVALVGPGLDFINKADGQDFYPEQTIQPFTLIDSLVRLRLSRLDELSLTTFDVSRKVNEHLEAARDRARAGMGYVIEMPLSDAEKWSSGLVGYWERAGDRVGEAVPASRVPPSADRVRVRAIMVRPQVVLSIVPRDLNIVVERLELPKDERFDLVVATNVLIYYSPFEQALAVANIGQLLRPAGSLLTNQAVLPIPPFARAVGQDAVVYSDRQFDPVFWYRRQ